MLDGTSFWLQTFANMFLSLIRISCQISKIHRETFHVDLPIDNAQKLVEDHVKFAHEVSL